MQDIKDNMNFALVLLLLNAIDFQTTIVQQSSKTEPIIRDNHIIMLTAANLMLLSLAGLCNSFTNIGYNLKHMGIFDLLNV